MENVSVESLKQQIRVALDENHISTELTGLQDTDTLTLDELIVSKIEDAAEAVVRSAPIELLGDLSKPLGGDVDISQDLVARMYLPNDFLRLTRFRMTGWPFAVFEALLPSRDALIKLSSPYGVYGTNDRPVVLISPTNDVPCIRLIPAYMYGDKMYRPLGSDGKLKANATSSDFNETTEVKGSKIDVSGVYVWNSYQNVYSYYVWVGDVERYDAGQWTAYTPIDGKMYRNIDTGKYYQNNNGALAEVTSPTRNCFMLEAFRVESITAEPDCCLYVAKPKINKNANPNPNNISLGDRLERPTVYYAASLVASALGNGKAAEELLAVCKEMLNLQ